MENAFMIWNKVKHDLLKFQEIFEELGSPGGDFHYWFDNQWMQLPVQVKKIIIRDHVMRKFTIMLDEVYG